MLKSFFGDLTSKRPAPPAEDDDDGFAATAIMENFADARPSAPAAALDDPHAEELKVEGDPATALRAHFAGRADQEATTKVITIVDPVRVWATLVIGTLSEACAHPIERLHLREHDTERLLATVERTTVIRQNTDQLKVAHADVRATGPEGAGIQVALMERSHMTTIVVGPMQAQAIDALLASLKDAATLSTWRCPTLLFLLPPNAAWIQHKIQGIAWPLALQVLVVEEPLTSASAVWNAMVAQWRLAKAQQTWARDVLLARRHETLDFSESAPGGLQVAIPGTAAAMPAKMVVTPELAGAAGRPQPTHLQADQAQTALAKMASMDGLLACALVNDETSQVLARDTRLGQDLDLERTALACAQLMRAHRQSALLMGLSAVDEITTSSGGRQVMLRPASRRPGFFMMALLDKQRTNMTLARLRLMELDKHLT
jgi:hypothetical protein